MNDAAVALGRALRHVVGTVEHEHMQPAFGELARDAGANASRANDDNIPHAVGRRLRAAREALAAGERALSDCLGGTIALEQRVA